MAPTPGSKVSGSEPDFRSVVTATLSPPMAQAKYSSGGTVTATPSGSPTPGAASPRAEHPEATTAIGSAATPRMRNIRPHPAEASDTNPLNRCTIGFIATKLRKNNDLESNFIWKFTFYQFYILKYNNLYYLCRYAIQARLSVTAIAGPNSGPPSMAGRHTEAPQRPLMAF